MLGRYSFGFGYKPFFFDRFQFKSHSSIWEDDPDSRLQREEWATLHFGRIILEI
jgi:hypothetical protein